MKLVDYLKNAIDFLLQSGLLMLIVMIVFLIVVPMTCAAKKSIENQKAACERIQK